MKLVLTVILAIIVPLATAQTINNDFGSSSRMPKGEIHVRVEPAPWGRTLPDLTKRADLIVEGLVDASIPARQEDPVGNPTHIETDVVFLVSKFFKGKLPAQKELPRVVVAEHGGTVGQLEISTDEPRMQQGEHWILFLQQDGRSTLKGVGGLPRYLVIGAWNGKVKVENGKISVPAHSAPELKTHHLEDHDAFAAEVSKALAAPKQ